MKFLITALSPILLFHLSSAYAATQELVKVTNSKFPTVDKMTVSVAKNGHLAGITWIIEGGPNQGHVPVTLADLKQEKVLEQYFSHDTLKIQGNLDPAKGGVLVISFMTDGYKSTWASCPIKLEQIDGKWQLKNAKNEPITSAKMVLNLDGGNPIGTAYIQGFCPEPSKGRH